MILNSFSCALPFLLLYFKYTYKSDTAANYTFSISIHLSNFIRVNFIFASVYNQILCVAMCTMEMKRKWCSYIASDFLFIIVLAEI